MQIEKFYQTQTGQLVYVVIGAKNRMEAFKFVAIVKMMNCLHMTLKTLMVLTVGLLLEII